MHKSLIWYWHQFLWKIFRQINSLVKPVTFTKLLPKYCRSRFLRSIQLFFREIVVFTEELISRIFFFFYVIAFFSTFPHCATWMNQFCVKSISNFFLGQTFCESIATLYKELNSRKTIDEEDRIPHFSTPLTMILWQKFRETTFMTKELYSR